MLQVSMQTTIFMQKAIYFVSKLIAARGMIELTDRSLNFQVSPLDASFGMKDLTIERSSSSRTKNTNSFSRRGRNSTTGCVI